MLNLYECELNGWWHCWVISYSLWSELGSPSWKFFFLISSAALLSLSLSPCRSSLEKLSTFNLIDPRKTGLSRSSMCLSELASWISGSLPRRLTPEWSFMLNV